MQLRQGQWPLSVKQNEMDHELRFTVFLICAHD